MSLANLWMGFDDRTHPVIKEVDLEGDRIHPVNKGLGHLDTPGIFREDNPNGPRHYELWSLYYEVETEQDLRDIRNDLFAEFPGQVRTIGSWWMDGRMVGTEWELDQDGNRTGNTTGNPIFPLHTRILEFIPDDSDGGDPPVLTRPTDITTAQNRDANRNMGQADRRFV